MRFMDAVRKHMVVVEVTEEDAEGRTKLRWKTAVATNDGSFCWWMQKQSVT